MEKHLLAVADNLKMPNIGKTRKKYIFNDADNLKMANIGKTGKTFNSCC